MALTVGTNSWVTVAESNLYLADKYGAGDWAGLADGVKEQLLITAFWTIYSSPDYTIAKTSTNELVKNAQIETAWFMYTYDSEIWKRLALQGIGVTEFGISEFRERLSKGSPIPFVAAGMLADFSTYAGSALFERELD